jgi:hypothetical protein
MGSRLGAAWCCASRLSVRDRLYLGMLCHQCGTREAEIFQTQHVGGKSYERNLCALCAKQDYGVFLGALLQSQVPGGEPLTDDEQREVRRVLDQAAPPEE